MSASDPTFGVQEWLEAGACRIAAWRAGPPCAPLLAFCHGATLDRRLFAAQVEALRERFRILSWDLPGHGESGSMPRGWSIADACEALASLLGSEKSRAVVLVGQSFGGDVCQEFARRHPDRVTGMVLLGTLCLTEPRALLARLSARISVAKLRVLPMQRFRRQVVESIAGGAETKAYATSCLGTMTRRNLVRLWSAMARAPRADQNARVPCATRLLIGANDNLGGGFLQQGAARWAARDARVDLVKIPEAGHLANHDQPALVTREILRLVEEQGLLP